LGGTELHLVLAHGAFERRVFEPPAEHAEEEEVFAFHSPGCAHRKITELGRLVGGVPALHDAVEWLRNFLVTIALEPFLLDQTAAQWGGGLLILPGEVVFTNRAPNAVESYERLAVEVQSLALSARKAPRPPDRLDPMHFVAFGDRRKAQDIPWLLRDKS
jgi:hypothetical protein